MNELLMKTETEQRENRTAQKKVNIKLDFDAFRFAENEFFDNDFDFFNFFVIEYANKKISEYKRLKNCKGKRKDYETARFPTSDRHNIMRVLENLLEIKTEKLNAKTTQYYILSVNQAALDREIEKAKFLARKAA